MTEEEAKTKWCPMARTSQGLGANGFNRIDEGKPSKDSFCMASDCMMWREQLIRIENTKSELIRIEEHGYCGLAK